VVVDVVVVGSVNVDQVARVQHHPAPGQTVAGTGPDLLAGGKGANQALAATRRGAATALVAAVGTDDAATTALAGLAAAGVDLGRVSRREGPTGLAVITVDAAGENTIVVLPGANASLSPEDVDAAAGVLAGARVCVLQGEVPAATTAHAARTAAAAGTRVLLNLAPPLPLPAGVLALADPLVVNEHEARAVLGDAGPASSPAELAAALAGRARSAVVTLGGDGAVVASRELADLPEPVRVPAPAVEVLDTTGAGDAFAGALAAALAAGDDLVAAVRTAVRVGAAAVRTPGAQGALPGPDDDLP